MTVVASIAAGNVAGILTRGSGAVVTRLAQPEHLQMIDPDDRHPGYRAMTVFTDIGRIDMHRVLAGRGCTVVATETISGHVGMVEASREPGVRAMTVLALVTALRVIRRLTRPAGTVVTTAATADHLRVINTADGTPVGLPMAVLA